MVIQPDSTALQAFSAILIGTETSQDTVTIRRSPRRPPGHTVDLPAIAPALARFDASALALKRWIRLIPQP
jgi:hypothetical protein